MTEAEWLACEDPGPMLRHLSRGESHRRDRLFLAACCRRLWHLFTDPHLREAVELAERHADGEASWEERELRASPEPPWLDVLELVDVTTWVWQGLAFAPICELSGPTRLRGFGHPRGEGLDLATGGLFACLAMYQPDRDEAALERAGKQQVALVRCVYGNPFRPPKVDRSRLTPTVASLALAAYEHRDLPSGHLELARLAVLSDALEEADCTDADLLAHLRSPGPHMRGCWALDLIRGRE
jgi:hypothetical protein